MFKDPLTRWPGLFPYDALAEVGITPESSMEEVRDASFQLMVRGRMTPEVRRAWDEVRTVPRRRLIDFLLYPVDLEGEVHKARKAVEEELREWGQEPDPTPLQGVEAKDLDTMTQDFRPFELTPNEVRWPPDFERYSPFDDDDFVVFDR